MQEMFFLLVTGIRIDPTEMGTNLRWVPTEKQHADALTKRCSKLRDAFRRWMQSPTATLVESRTAEDGEGNHAWRSQGQEKNRPVQYHHDI